MTPLDVRIEKIWREYDRNDTGVLLKDLAKEFLTDSITRLGDKNKKMNPQKFADLSKVLDAGRGGFVEKKKLVAFLKKIL